MGSFALKSATPRIGQGEIWNVYKKTELTCLNDTIEKLLGGVWKKTKNFFEKVEKSGILKNR